MQNFLYFRSEATLANDDATTDSVCYPVSALLGIEPSSDTALILSFAPLNRPGGHATSLIVDDAGNLPLADTVTLNITANTGKRVMQDIIGAINKNLNSGFIVVADDATAEPGGVKYVSSNITSCGAIVVNVAYDNA